MFVVVMAGKVAPRSVLQTDKLTYPSDENSYQSFFITIFCLFVFFAVFAADSVLHTVNHLLTCDLASCASSLWNCLCVKFRIQTVVFFFTLLGEAFQNRHMLPVCYYCITLSPCTDKVTWASARVNSAGHHTGI